MPDYDPLASDVTVDVTISGADFIVTAFSDNGAGAVGADFQNSDGSYRGQRKVTGPREASMTIEVTNAAQASPAQFDDFTYRSITWIIQTVSRSVSSTGPATITLALRQQSAEELDAITP